MMKTLYIVVQFSFLVLSSCAQKAPEQRLADKPDDVKTLTSTPRFEGESAFAYLEKQTSFGPRTPNSSGHAECLDYLASTLRGTTPSVELQTFRENGYKGESLVLTNVIARFRPEDGNRILLCAHWDSRPRADQDPDPAKRTQAILGANDGASGVAVLLEIARLLKETPPPVGVDIVLFDGEDYGREGDLNYYFLGAKHFAYNKHADYVPRFGILLDMIGDADLEIPREQNSILFAPDIVEKVWSAARSLGIWQFTDNIQPAVSDDHLVLNEVGIKTIDLIDFNYPYWHTTQDTPERCSAQSLEAVGTVITHVVYSAR